MCESRQDHQEVAPLAFLSSNEIQPDDERALVAHLRQIYGGQEVLIAGKLRSLIEISRDFIARYGDGPVELIRAPARINILGEHVDYVSYLPTSSLPFASREYDMLMLYRPNETMTIRGSSLDEYFPPFEFSFADVCFSSPDRSSIGDAWLQYLYAKTAAPSPHWRNYVQGAVYFARLKYQQNIRRGFDFLVASTIPACGGASSSSALVVLAGAAIREVNGIAFDDAEMALDASQAEWFIGTRGGAMDHQTICLARENAALLIAYAEKSVRHLHLPTRNFRWVTFFTHSADKGSRVMLAYNERAAVSRLLIPALLDDWRSVASARHSEFLEALVSFRAAPHEGALDTIAVLLSSLPETITLAEVARRYPRAYQACQQSFPLLVTQKSKSPLAIRHRALHHLGEMRRVLAAENILDQIGIAAHQQESEIETGMRELGALINKSHESLRDMYEVSTTEVEELRRIIISDSSVYGARLMGGGFGGNILILTTADHAARLTERAQRAYYAPRGRDAVAEKSVAVSTPGRGLSSLSSAGLRRATIASLSARVVAGDATREDLTAALDALPAPDDATHNIIQPLIVAAGSGMRAVLSGLDVPKPLAQINNRPAIGHVLQSLRRALTGKMMRRPIVIVSIDNEREIRAALVNEDVSFVRQDKPRGTGDAVRAAGDVLRDFKGRLLIIWSTQPVIRPETIERAAKLAALYPTIDLIFPTVIKENPYAPLFRDARGRVSVSRETHLEGALRVAAGETNIGLFLAYASATFAALDELHARYWNGAADRYERPRGELGFPNEIINYLAAAGRAICACPFAGSREEQGIKDFADVKRCSQFINALEDKATPSHIVSSSIATK